jgi:hypothetical protein
VSADSERLAGLSAADKRALLARMLREKKEQSRPLDPLSHGQRALWFLQQLAPDSAANNEAFAWRIRANLDADKLKLVMQALVDRHPALRTTYTSRGGEPMAVVNDRQPCGFEVSDASAWSPELLQQRLAESANRPFDLEHGPVFRVHFFKRSAQDYIILTNVHHIAVDLWSMVIIMEDLQALYLSQQLGVPASLPPLTQHPHDFVRWQTDMLQGPEGQRHWNYWQRQLGGELPVLDLPTDRPRPPIQTYRGSTHAFSLGVELTNQLKAFAKANQTTLYTTLLAAYQVLLGRYSGQEDLLVGSITAGRSQPRFERVVGYLANPVALRADLSGDPPFLDFLAQVRQTVLDAIEHQDYPFSLLVERLLPHRDPSRAPLVDAVFILQKPHGFESARKDQRDVTPFGVADTAKKGGQVAFAGTPVELFLLEHHIAKFDLELEMFESGVELTGWMRYNTELFDSATVVRLERNFQTLLAGIVQDPNRPISELPALSDEERRLVLAASEPPPNGIRRNLQQMQSSINSGSHCS